MLISKEELTSHIERLVGCSVLLYNIPDKSMEELYKEKMLHDVYFRNVIKTSTELIIDYFKLFLKGVENDGE